ncbi:hypothetical protein J6TS2_53010 [Heyndrickxia sporothermodurans]|nr:hypothetical protein J6TS2_53010 [Heyndrickxia sporothermodurans]
MGKTRKTYDINFKKKVVDLHLNDGMGYNTIASEIIDKIQIRRWVNHFIAEGIKGIEKKEVRQKDLVKVDQELVLKIQKSKLNALK